MIFPFINRNKINSFFDCYIYLTQTIVKESKSLIKIIEENQGKVPFLLMNGKKDIITNYLMLLDLNKRISFPKLALFENLGHGSRLLGKGDDKIINCFIEFLRF